jgi:hypothetical protein
MRDIPVIDMFRDVPKSNFVLSYSPLAMPIVVVVSGFRSSVPSKQLL